MSLIPRLLVAVAVLLVVTDVGVIARRISWTSFDWWIKGSNIHESPIEEYKSHYIPIGTSSGNSGVSRKLRDIYNDTSYDDYSFDNISEVLNERIESILKEKNFTRYGQTKPQESTPTQAPEQLITSAPVNQKDEPLEASNTHMETKSEITKTEAPSYGDYQKFNEENLSSISSKISVGPIIFIVLIQIFENINV